MANGNYTYNPAEIKDKTVSRMRFELGDTMVEGNSDTAALTDEEIQVAIDSYPKSWKKAKLMLLESLYRRFSYEVDTKTGPLTLNLHDRAVMWKEDYLALKKEIQQESCSVPPFAGGATNKPPYFYTGMLLFPVIAWYDIITQDSCMQDRATCSRSLSLRITASR